MAAGGFREFVAGETLDEDEINDYLMQGMLVFAGTAARGSAIGTPVEGQFSFLKDTDTVEFYDGSAWTVLSAAVLEFLVVAGGGGAYTGGGGAGGLVEGQESTFSGQTFKVKIGAGGSGGAVTGTVKPTAGASSFFGDNYALGGGQSGTTDSGASGFDGGSGGGGAGDGAGGPKGDAIAGDQGFDGGTGSAVLPYPSGGGGGAGGVGINGTGSVGGNGGTAIFSEITGSTVSYAGGGGGAVIINATGTAGLGGGTSTTANKGGGGDAGFNTSGFSGTANTGGGGGGLTGYTTGGRTGGSGGSGVVILRYPSSLSLTVGAGLTSSTATDGASKVTTITAGEDTVTFS